MKIVFNVIETKEIENLKHTNKLEYETLRHKNELEELVLKLKIAEAEVKKA